MTCLIGEAVDGPGMKSHTSMLGTFFVYTLGLSMPIFKKKSLRRFLGKSSKLWVLHKNDFLCNTQSLELFPRNLREDFFLKIGILSPKVYTKIRPQHRSMKLHPCLAQRSVFQASHWSALLIGCVKFCSRLYISALLSSTMFTGGAVVVRHPIL